MSKYIFINADIIFSSVAKGRFKDVEVSRVLQPVLVPITAGITMSSAGYEKDLVIMVKWDTLYTLRQFSYWLRHTVEKVLNRLELIPAINYCLSLIHI